MSLQPSAKQIINKWQLFFLRLSVVLFGRPSACTHPLFPLGSLGDPCK